MYQYTIYTLLVLFMACSTEPIKDFSSTKYTNQQLGQLLVVGFRGSEINSDSDIVKDLKEFNLAGVVLFDYDIESGEFDRHHIFLSFFNTGKLNKHTRLTLMPK